jgi:hypothetical protein
MSLHRKLSASSVLLGTLLFTPMLPAQNPVADLVLIHGHILTVDVNDSVAQAIAIRRGVIVKVGTDADVLEFVRNGPGTRVIDLHGHTATPGLIDTHAHIAEGGVEELYGVKLSDATSVADIVARVKAKIALVKAGEWVTGSGWDEGKLAEHRYVIAADVNGGFQRDVDSRSDQFIPDASCTLQNPLPRSALIRAIGNVHSLGMEHC